MISFFKELPEYSADLLKSKTNLENSPVMLKAAIEVLEKLEDWNVTSLHDVLMTFH